MVHSLNYIILYCIPFDVTYLQSCFFYCNIIKVQLKTNVEQEMRAAMLDLTPVWEVGVVNRCTFPISNYGYWRNKITFFAFNYVYYFFKQFTKLLGHKYLARLSESNYYINTVVDSLFGLRASWKDENVREPLILTQTAFPKLANFKLHSSECLLASHFCRKCFYLNFNRGHPL